MAKKNYAKYLPKVGGTVAMTVAMAAALAVPAQATELDSDLLNQEPTPVAEAPAETPAPAPAPAPENTPIVTSTPAANTSVPDNTPAPDNTPTPDNTPAPVSFELPGTNVQVETENNGIIAENQDVADDNQDIIDNNNNIAGDNEFNTGGELTAPDLTEPTAPQMPDTDGLDAEGYNDAAKDYEDQAEDYNNAVDEYNQGVKDYNDAAQNYDDQAQQEYDQALEDHNQAVSDREAEQKEYDEVTLPDWQAKDAAYQQYLKDLETYEAYLKDYNEDLLPTYEADGGAAHEETVIAFENYKAAVEQWKTDYENYKNQYETDNENAYKAALEAYIKPFKDAYDAAVAKEQTIYQNVENYNKQVEDDNKEIAKKNDDLLTDVNSNYAEHLGAAENNAGVVVDQEILTTLGGYQDLLASQSALEAAAAALNTHSGKDAKLDTPEYAAYLKAVEDYNAQVKIHNDKVDAYNDAIDIYNKAVEDYNLAQEAEDDIFVDTSNSTGTADWGNITINSNTYFNHIDVKYAAAISQDKVVDENGKLVTDGEDTYSKYTVTGVYTDANAAKTTPNTYGVSYRNGSDGKTQTHYIQSLPEHHEFGHPSHNGAKLDVKDGEISFYVKLVDEETKEEYGITVNMDAASTYPPGTYYKAIGTDKLASFRYGTNNSQKLSTVTIDGETYFDISGQSVFVISALTCDGMMQWGYHNNLTLNPNGLDLVLNMQTLIEIHKAGNAQKLGYVNLEYGKTAQNEAPQYGEYEGNPEGFEYEDLAFNPPAPPKPDKPDTVADPGERPVRPEDYTEQGPTAPTPTGRLEELSKLDTTTLFDKFIFTFNPVDPDPIPVTPTNVTPRTVSNYYASVALGETTNNRTIILDEEVPLADAPLTGDISGIWAAISAFSLGGFSLLGRKRKNEDA